MSNAVAPEWSEPVAGLAGRIYVAFEDLQPGLRHAIWLELKNHSSHPVAVVDQPKLRTELRDSLGQLVPRSGLQVSGPISSPEWAVIPQDAYLGIRVDVRTLGVPTREHGVALFALGGKAWQIGPGEYVLRATLTYSHRPAGPANQWVGKLVLPPVDVVVTPQMVALDT